MRRREALRAGLGLVAGSTLSGIAAGATAATSDGAAAYEPLGRVKIDGAKEAVVSGDGRTVFVAATTGYAAVDLSDPAHPEVVAERRDLLADREGGPLRGIYDAKVEGDRLIVVGPAHGRPGAVAGVLVVDASDPAAPERRAFHETDYPIHNCFLRGNYAYLTGNDGAENPLVIVDVDTGEAVGRWSLADHDPAWTDVLPSVRTLHDVWVQGGVAYLALWDAGTWLVDVSDPTAPSAVSSIGGRPPAELASLSDADARRAVLGRPGNHHYVATNGEATLLGVGVESWAASVDGELHGGPGGIELWDVSDPETPTRRSRIAPPATPDPTHGGVWTTAHNFELSGEHLYSSWYRGGVKRHDISDPADPRETTWWRDAERARFWTARRAGDRSVFVASSMGTDAAAAALYAFPDHPGSGGRPVADVSDRTPSDSELRETPARTPLEADPTGRSPETGTERTPATTDATGSGFGATEAGTAAGLLAAYWRHRTRR